MNQIFEELRRGYLYALPLVMSEAIASGNPRNVFVHKPGPADAERRIVARPGVDQVASYAWLDLSASPMVLTAPATYSAEYPKGRYLLYQIMDAWTNVIALLGTGFANNNNGGTYVFVGPDYKGDVPEHMQRIDCPTNLTIIWSRTFCLDLSEMPAITELKSHFRLEPLHPEQYAVQAAPEFPAKGRFPVEMVSNLDLEAFFNYFNKLAAMNAPCGFDGPILKVLAKYGIGAGLTFRMDQFAPELRQRLAKELIPSVLDHVSEMFWQDSEQINYWNYSPADLGYYGENYQLRGAVAVNGYAANPTEVCQYLTADHDGSGQPLNGKHRYRIHFDRDKLPPIHELGYWSLVAYDGREYFLIANPMKRYRLSGMSKELKYNKDGSLDLLVQNEPPADEWLGNYLPVCTDLDYCLCLRLYLPLKSVEEHTWVPPLIERLD